MPKNTEAKIRAEIEQSEAHPDAPGDTQWSQRNRARSTVYSVRLNPDEVTRVEHIAQRLQVPASTLVRGWILDALTTSENDTVLGALDRVEADLHRLRDAVTR